MIGKVGGNACEQGEEEGIVERLAARSISRQRSIFDGGILQRDVRVSGGGYGEQYRLVEMEEEEEESSIQQ